MNYQTHRRGMQSKAHNTVRLCSWRAERCQHEVQDGANLHVTAGQPEQGCISVEGSLAMAASDSQQAS